MGLTRGLTPHEVGRLTREESRELMAGFCRRFGIDGSGHREELAELAAPTEGWPRHLHYALQALGRQAVAADGDLRRVDWGLAARQAADGRRGYYAYQQSPEMEAAAPLVALVMAELERLPSRSEVTEFVRAVTAGNPRVRLPKNVTADDLYDHLLHQGAIQEREDDSVHCPIPSFRDFLVARGGELAANAVLPGRTRPDRSACPDIGMA